MALVLPVGVFPKAAWFHSYLKAEEVILEVHDHWQKAGFRNRYSICAREGAQLWSIPVAGGRSHHRPYADVLFIEKGWQRRHLQAIRTAYGSAPFFEHYFPELEAHFQSGEGSLLQWNVRGLELCLKWMKTAPRHRLSESWIAKYPEGVSDARFHPEFLSEMFPNPYYQVFLTETGFVPGLSILDVFFNLGPDWPKSMGLSPKMTAGKPMAGPH